MRLFGLPKPTLPENYPELFDPAILSIFSKTHDPPTTNLSGPDRWRYSVRLVLHSWKNTKMIFPPICLSGIHS